MIHSEYGGKPVRKGCRELNMGSAGAFSTITNRTKHENYTLLRVERGTGRANYVLVCIRSHTGFGCGTMAHVIVKPH